MEGKWDLSVDADLDNLSRVRDFVEEIGTTCGLGDESLGNLLVAVDEAITNIVNHGYRGAPGIIDIACERVDGAFVIRLSDQAPVYNPLDVAFPDPTQSPLDREAPGGFGVVLIKSMVDEVTHRPGSDGGNELTLRLNGV